MYTKYSLSKLGLDTGSGTLTFGTKDGANCNLQTAKFALANDKFKLTSSWKQIGNKLCPDSIDCKLKDLLKSLEGKRFKTEVGYGGNLYFFYD